VVDGRFALLLPDDPAVWAFTRTLGDRVLLVLANLSGDPVTISPDDVPDLSGSQVLLPTHAPPYGSTLRPWESRIERGRLDPGTSQTARR
jgi:oligo-1,6-glucosidase